MTDDFTHASFFSGAGGLDLGLERAGWRTVSFSEIDPYACAVLAERWPGVPNLGDVTALASGGPSVQTPSGDTVQSVGPEYRVIPHAGDRRTTAGDDWHDATLWTAGFPCQDLSVAGKRQGFRNEDGTSTRSGLALAFLDLVGRHRPPFLLLENVPGLLSSHGGRDMAALLGAMVELGYGVGYRMFDGQFFGVPQRRKRVFILGDALGGRAGAERAAAVLSVGSQCAGHPEAGRRTGKKPARAAGGGAVQSGEIIGTLDGTFGHHGGALGGDNIRQGHLITEHHPKADPRGVRAASGLAGRAHDRVGVDLAPTLNSNKGVGWRYDADQAESLVVQVTSGPKMFDASGYHRERMSDTVTPTISDYEQPMAVGPLEMGDDDPLLPAGLDSHRYRVIGNGVISHVGEFIGLRLAEVLRDA